MLDIERSFLTLEAVRSPPDGTPPRWADLLTAERTVAVAAVADALGLPPSGRARPLLSGSEILLFVPRAKRRRRQLDRHRLVLTIEDREAILFHPPTPIGVSRFELPHAYVNLVTSLGSCRTGKHGGELVPPDGLDSLGHRVAELANVSDPIRAFFDHGTGDYSCWVGGDHDTAHRFDHERRTLRLEWTGSFSAWLEESIRCLAR